VVSFASGSCISFGISGTGAARFFYSGESNPGDGFFFAQAILLLLTSIALFRRKRIGVVLLFSVHGVRAYSGVTLQRSLSAEQARVAEYL
jgi:hypothetical protein